MTNPVSHPGPDNDDQEHDGDVLAVRETVSVGERLKTTTCAWCGERIVYAGVGRPPKYCRDSHRKRASEVRTAQRRAARPVDQGGQTTEPVREVVERTETVTRTTVRRGPAKVRLPEDIYEWQHALVQLQNAVRAGRLAGFHEVLVRDLEATAAVVRERQEHIEQRVAGLVPAPRPPRPQGSKKKRRKRR
ncbi:hypothetical protein NC239_36440 [Streptomyces sp. G3]|uniref:hypothetical protein n=1 Tax=Streptomyces sp. G3 TaxID=690144 RepID=UPI0020304840|nr:hypothetical protein [Streptomyces sp. G3]MCM1943681.1 hypothetical protein [Streptomyces sp. G3]